MLLDDYSAVVSAVGTSTLIGTRMTERQGEKRELNVLMLISASGVDDSFVRGRNHGSNTQPAESQPWPS